MNSFSSLDMREANDLSVRLTPDTSPYQGEARKMNSFLSVDMRAGNDLSVRLTPDTSPCQGEARRMKERLRQNGSICSGKQ